MDFTLFTKLVSMHTNKEPNTEVLNEMYTSYSSQKSGTVHDFVKNWFSECDPDSHDVYYEEKP